ncbi:MAG: Rieske 2Fe-2S domain-containing protein [candidate division Zixibacteria bacterium]|nr:Rieske 2Fe-2S domain-containing protein [candidate division Zixibacteria bacterium]
MDYVREEGEQPVERRSFLHALLAGAVSLLGAYGAYVVGRYLWPPRPGSTGGAAGRVEAGAEDEFPVGAGKKIVYRNKPAWVIHAPFGFVALSAVCTHLGCIVEYDPEKKIWCPCHAGFFDLRGNVISGPPPRPLPSYPVAVVGGKVLVGET